MRLFSGVRPTGSFHLGNYLGAVRQWVALSQKTQDCLFCVVDWHALTTLADSTDLAASTRQIAATYLACGLDPDRCTIFSQSCVPGHLELAWYLGCQTPLSWLYRMTQFKDKGGAQHDHANWGLLSYPVLMAADILIYQTTHVPVGDDQKQHVELARDIAVRWNQHVGDELFMVPEPMILPEAARIMSLRDGHCKMSKSDPSDYSRIHLTDSNDQIALKLKKAKTDPYPLPHTLQELDGRPEAKNLLQLLSIFSDQTLESTIAQYAGAVFSRLKEDLIDAITAHVTPIRERLSLIMNDPSSLDSMLKQHGQKARDLAMPTQIRVRQALHLWNA